MEVERRARKSAPAPYRRRRPEDTLLFRTVQTHFATWLAQCRDGHDSGRFRSTWSVGGHRPRRTDGARLSRGVRPWRQRQEHRSAGRERHRALAAIQGLHAELRQRDEHLTHQSRMIEALAAAVSELQRGVQGRHSDR